jgi:hypothetical protein
MKAQAHARARAGAQGLRGTLLPSLRDRWPFVWLWVPGLAALARDTRDGAHAAAEPPAMRYLGTRPITAFARAA